MTLLPQRPIALALGDPNGIGPEIAVKAAQALSTGPQRVRLVGDVDVVAYYAARHAAGLPLQVVAAEAPGTAAPALEVVPVQSLPAAAFAPGHISAAAGQASVDYARAAIDLVVAGHAQAVVAAPHTERAVHAAGIDFSGYPRLLAEHRGIDATQVFLMLVGGGLRVVHVTLHQRLADALAGLTSARVEAAIRAAADTFSSAGEPPRIGVFGINPHAGEDGLFGDEDMRITMPAVQRLRREGIEVIGPVGADVLLAENHMDVYVAMYHDQGHIPVKLLAGRESSAVSIGAGVAFASVGHGSALDIAGRGLADPSALLRTLRMIGDLDRRAPLPSLESV